jgi:phage shock protein E
MLDTIKNIFGLEKTDYAELKNKGAIILDVRSKSEYDAGHIRGSVNISVDQLVNNLGKLKDKNKPIITCCASGARSGAAKNLLKSLGYTEVYNGGPWDSLQNKI